MCKSLINKRLLSVGEIVIQAVCNIMMCNEGDNV